MELLGERPVWSMRGGELLSTLDALEAEIARLETCRLHVVGAIETTGYAAELGARDTAELLRFRYRLDASTARRTFRLAQALPKYPSVSAALDATAAVEPEADPDAADAEGDGAQGDDAAAGGWLLRPAQAEAIVSALERVPAHVPVEDRDVAERELVGLAAHLCPAELRQAGTRMRDVLDTDGPEPEEAKAAAAESLTLTAADRGVKFRGYLANENAELFRALIHAGARPRKTVDGERDPRSREKRQADALSTTLTIAAAATDSGYLRPRTATPAHEHGPHQDGTHHDGARADGGGLASATAAGHVPAEAEDAGPFAGADAVAMASGDDVLPGFEDVVPAEWPGAVGPEGGDVEVAGVCGAVPGFGAKAQLTVTIDFRDLQAATADACGQLVFGDGLSAATVRRLACDAKIIPLVLGTNSEPLDVGRSERLVTRAIRRALNARDNGCVVCGAPPIMCDAHHLTSWIDGGETKVENLALTCRRHHVDVHDGQWTIRITNGVVHVARPAWAEPPPTRLIRRKHQQAAGSRPAPDDAAAGRSVAGASEAGGTVVSIARTSRWKADEAALREAAEFASINTPTG
ncbi:HNH endonuclease [Kribbella jejuensis]|uniref:Uncharacterized protein DUF222 n=1 Tax=Kribbella jejuensis TaxID=236068 RepID=A0A542EQC8_9ACTN|nr:HNH endonuclease signature motif containing protein [Kribbella jejuensis]TQJ17434.1 uncharacterized protein DUF222 [Kribbella jejuensis]